MISGNAKLSCHESKPRNPWDFPQLFSRDTTQFGWILARHAKWGLFQDGKTLMLDGHFLGTTTCGFGEEEISEPHGAFWQPGRRTNQMAESYGVLAS